MEQQVIPEYAEYFAHLTKYRDELKTALENERSKRQALLDSNMDRLESVLSLQQAETMKLRSMEAKRLSMQQAFGSPEETAAQFVSGISDGQSREAFSKLVAEMTELASQIREQNALALEIAKTNIRLLDRIFSNTRFDQSKATYGPEGERRGDFGGHSVELKF